MARTPALRWGAIVIAVVCLPILPAPIASSETTADRAAIEDLLDRRARAFLERDESAFMATVARFDSAFVARQRRLFRWTNGIDLSTYELAPDWRRYGDLVTDSIRSTYREADDVAVASVEERYALSGFDEQPAVEDLYLTFVRTDGDWLVAGDTDLDNLTLYSSRHLWDFDRITTERRGRFLLLSHPCRRGEPCGRAPAGATALAATALERVAEYWPVRWRRRVAVLVPSDAHELERLLQVTFDVDNFVAFATSSVDVRGGIDYTGHRIVLNPAAFVGRPTESTFEILAHELLHVATRDSSGPFIPVWVEEGFAEYVGTAGDPDDLTFFNSRVAAGLFDGRLPEDFEFTIGSRTEIFMSYQKSLAAVHYFIDRWGIRKFVRFYKTLGRVEIAPGTARRHIDRALRRTVGVDLDEFERAWAGSLS
jgi:hypothetical protein